MFTMKIISFISTVVLSVALLSCASVNTSKHTQSNLLKVSSARFNGEVQFVFNSDSTSAICIGNKKNLGQTFSFFVYSMKANESLTKTYNNISIVNWKSIDSIQYRYLQGVVRSDERTSDFSILNLSNKP